ncbi:unnamed protein product [Bursaphelenchus okinawaensis]|uniref:Uncharacterized protein n=1 Tax=Bursaphelenchus okinawaensis TaxID=465554 RepID=A0A811JR22_9BILA|nr:unnamed protein product [Bursaphelenchus okinawaensis]CAG9079256.1 unnamed protein product [Bursaphelenchus okinawaensis]
MGSLSKRFGQQFTEQCLVPHLIRAIDDINSRVRMSCADVFADIASNCSMDLRRNVLAPYFMRLLEDKQKFIRMSSSSQIGPIIATFAEPRRTGLLIRDGQLSNLTPRKELNTSNLPDESDSHNESTSSIGSKESRKTEETTENEVYETEEGEEDELGRLYNVPDGFHLPDTPKSETRVRTYSTSSISSLDSDNSVLTASPNFREVSSYKNIKPRNLFEESDQKQEDEEKDDQLFALRKWPYEPNKHLVSLNDPDFNLDDIMSEDLDSIDLDGEMEKDLKRKAQEEGKESPSTVPRLNLDEITPPEERTNNPSDTANSNTMQNGTPRGEEEPLRINYWSFDTELDFDDVQKYIERSESLNKANAEQSEDELNGNVLQPVPEDNEDSQYDTAFPPISESTGQENADRESSPGKRSWADVARQGSDLENAEDSSQDPSKQTTEGFWKRRFDFARKPIDFMKKTAAQSMLLHQTALSAATNTGNNNATSATSALIAKIRPMTQNMTNMTKKTEKQLKNDNVATVAPFRQFTEKVKQKIQGTAEKRDEPKPEAIWEQKAEIEAEELQSRIHQLQRRHLENAKRYLSNDEYQLLMNTEQDVIPPRLFNALSQLQQEDEMEDSDEHQIILAKCFPAIAYTFGPQKWIFVKALYMSLASHPSPTIRAYLAQSIHEIAKCIGQKRTDQDLVPIFQKFGLDTPDVQKGLIANLYEFFKACSEEVRLKLAAELNRFNTMNGRCEWRLRHQFIQQLSLMVQLFKPYHVNLHLIPFALAFANDRIAEVRKGGVKMLAQALAVLINHEQDACQRSGLPIDSPDARKMSREFMGELRKGFWNTMIWRKRQCFAQMMDTLARERLVDPTVFFQIFRQNMDELSMDKIHNVRQYYCTILQSFGRQQIDAVDQGVSFSQISDRLHEMAARDPDLEIRTQARVVLGTFDTTKHEIDLGQREFLLAAAEEKDRRVRVEKLEHCPKTFVTNEHPEVKQQIMDLPSKYAEIQRKSEALSNELNAAASTSVSNNQFSWIRQPRLRRDGVSDPTDDKTLSTTIAEEYQDIDVVEDGEESDALNTTTNIEDDLEFHDLEYDEPANDFIKKHPALIVAKVAPQPSNEAADGPNNESTV